MDVPDEKSPPNPGSKRSLALALALAAGAVTLSFSVPGPHDGPGDAAAGAEAPAAAAAPETPFWEDAGVEGAPSDPRARAFLQTYRPHIDSVTYLEDDVVFHIGGTPIHFLDGRLLDAERRGRSDECDPLFYRYPLQPLSRPLPASDRLPSYCSDVLESLWGSTEGQIRAHGRAVRFLDHRMFVNERLIEPLAAVERDVLAAAEHDAAVAEWIEELDVTYSFIYRRIQGSRARSRHAFGLAVDFVPRSYEGRHVYWRWSRAMDREGWDEIPLSRRWSPPVRVIEIFERHGFVWGGKWPHFDTIHFEYRPEILLYNRFLARPAAAR